MIHTNFRRQFEQVLAESKIYITERQEETSINSVPLFDQHVDYLTNLPSSYWILPAGIITVGIKYREPLTEFFELLKGLISNIAHSVLG